MSRVETRHPLPGQLRLSDLESGPFTERNRKDRIYDWDFEIWYTARFGWIIPVLDIRRVPVRMKSRNVERRTYAVRIILDGASVEVVRAGLGPHVLEKFTVYGRKSREAALKPMLDLKFHGQAKAGDIRDVRSTNMIRRAARLF